MDSARYQRIKQIFSELVKAPSGHRDDLLAALCGDDPALEAEVRSLLEHDRIPAVELGPLAQQFGEVLGDMPEDSRPDEASRVEQIGTYRIVKQLGAGGMGIVYLAEQERPRRQVALKVIRSGLLAPSVLRRFEQEADVLGRLQHPGIAQIYEVGTAEQPDGSQPYFAMEYVDGRTLIEHVREHDLGMRDVLEMLCLICDAVEHAHQRGIIHRDLKPANILVDGASQPKILDFGIARVTDADLQVTTLQTSAGELIGTISYMSPEQVSGDPHQIDVRTDVHALGAILFELLTGRLPYQMEHLSVYEAVRILREQEPTKISAVDRHYRGDIETIVTTALEKDKQRRYQSARALADDIRRYLNDEPLRASPPSTFYRVRKFTKRNSGLVISVGTIILALAGGLAAATYGLITALEQRDQAIMARDESDTVVQFLVDMLTAVDPGEQGRAVRVVDVLDVASAGLSEKFADRPAVEARLHEAMGRSYQALGELAEAEPHLSESLRLRQALSKSTVPEVIGVANHLALLYIDQARYDEAEQLLREFTGRAETRLGPDHPDTLAALNSLAYVYQRQGRPEESGRLINRVLDAQLRMLGEDDPATWEAMDNLALWHKDQGHFEETAAQYRRLLALRKAHLPADHPKILLTMQNLGSTLIYLEKYDEAEVLLSETLAARRRVLGDQHQETRTSINDLAVLYSSMGRLEEAEPLFQEAVALSRAVLGDTHPHTLISIANMGDMYIEMEAYDRADQLLDEAVDAAQSGALPPRNWITGIFLMRQGASWMRQGRYEEAESALLEGNAYLVETFRQDHPRAQKVVQFLVELYETWNKPEQLAVWRARLVSESEPHSSPESSSN